MQDRAAIFRTYDRVKELQQQLNRLTLRYYLIGALAIGALGFPVANNVVARLSLDALSVSMFVSLWGVSPVLEPLKKRLSPNMQSAFKVPRNIGILEQSEHLPEELKKEKEGLDAELRIAQAIKDTFKKQRVKVFARLDNNCLIANPNGNKDLDILAAFPNGQRFAISVKKREAKLVYLDQENNIRVARKGGTVKMKRPDPAIELIEQEKWLRQNRRNLLLTPGNTMLLPSIRVLVFASPTIVGEQEPHQYASIGDKKFVKVQRDKDFVYLLQEDQLCKFMAAVLKPK